MDYKNKIKKTMFVHAILSPKEGLKHMLKIHASNICKIPHVPHVISPNKRYPNFEIKMNFDEYIILVKDSHKIVEIELNYKYFTYTEVLTQLLPKHVVPPASFETVGSIIHLNLTEDQLKYKNLIGEVIHDKTKKTVIAKIGNISSKYRYYELEIIGGKAMESKNREKKVDSSNKQRVSINEGITKEETKLGTLDKEEFSDLTTIHIENGVKFFVDLRKVYWCSKLQDERMKLLKLIKNNEVLYDVFCGVGPVTIPALKKGCTVYANDLNPDAIRCLRKGLKLNKVECNRLSLYNLDAGEFLDKMVGFNVDHIFLNLPEHSLDYLSQICSYNGSFMVHCYFFCACELDVVDFVYIRTGFRFDSGNFRVVRKVSPSKNMYKLEIPGKVLRESKK